MKKAVLVLGVLAAMIAVIAVAGCVASDPIVGTWESSTGIKIGDADLATTTMTFNSDGNGTYKGSLVGFTTTGDGSKFTWKKTSDGVYSVTDADGKVKEVKVWFSEDKKSMKYDSVEFTKL